MQQPSRQQTGGRTKATLFLVLALAAASMTAYVAWSFVARVQKQAARASEGPDTVQVLVAARTLYMGETLTEADVQPVGLRPDLIYPEMVFTEDELESLLNRVAKDRILQGEIIREERLADVEAGAGLNALIPPGYRAMTIDVDPESSLAGLLQPGNWVDVIVTIRPDDRNIEAKWVTKTILQKKRVLAIGDRLKPRSAEEKAQEGKRSARRKRPTVTLELTLEEAEELALASSRGDLHLILRSDRDNLQTADNEAVTTNSIIGLQPAGFRTPASAPTRRSTAPAPAASTNAEVIQGGETTSVQFDADGNRIDSTPSGRR